MGIRTAEKALISDAQYRALGAVIDRDGENVLRYTDTRTVMTLLALAKRKLVDVHRAHVDGAWRVTHATIRNAGRNLYAWETQRRAEQAAREQRHAAMLEQVARVSVTAQVDPFALVRTREVAIPF